MHLQDVLKSTLFQQTAPLIVLFLIPAFVFFASQFLLRLSLDRLVLGWYRSLSMGLESLGFSWLWTGSSSQSSASGSYGKRHKRKASGSTSKSKSVRTRADQIALKNVGKQPIHENPDSDLDDAQYYSGLVNISGTYCFMNSTLQAMASLTYLQPYIDAIHDKAEALDVPTPVIDALQELFRNLNTPKSSYHSLRPHGIITALSTPPQPFGGDKSTSVYRTSTSLFNSREHQDAQELFQLVSECVKNEMTAVDREGLRDRGIAGVLELARPSVKADKDESADLKSSKSVFDGLTANRRSCVVCGYTEAVMHFGFDNWQLAVPRLATSCRLEDCLEDYTRLEILKDCICRNCSMLATHRRLVQELKTLEEALAPPAPSASTSTSAALFSPGSPAASSSSMPSASPSKTKPSTSKKKRYKEVKRMEQRVRTAINEGRIEDDTLLEGVRLEKSVSPASTKQAMIARPPPVLALHLNRSVHYGQFAAKNTIRVYFPEVLDLTPYTTSGSLSTVPTSAISTPSPPPNHYATPEPQTQILPFSGASNDGSTTSSRPKRPTTPTQETYAPGFQRTIYRLAAVVCHYGQHSYGHYICYRRKPRLIGGKWLPPTLVDPLRLEMDDEEEEEEGQNDVAASQGSVNKPNGTVRTRTADYSGSSSLVGEPRYYWEDHTEEEVGTGRGWLRISDDAVSECGIESVLAEGTGAFMLYYEKAVHPRPGVYLRGRRNGNGNAQETGNGGAGKARRSRSRTGGVNGRAEYGYEDGIDGAADPDVDGDSFSIGSEETLKPEMKVVNLNGSVGSLISEVGVGVMKVHKKEKEKDRNGRKEKEKVERTDSMSMSVHLPISSTSSSLSSTSFGPRIVRSVNARRRNTPDTTGASSSSSGSNLGTTPGTSTASSPSPKVNGSALHEPHAEDEHDLNDNVLAEMTASAPSILASSSVANSALTPTMAQAQTKGQSYSRLGSKSTKVVHHPAGVKVKAQ